MNIPRSLSAFVLAAAVAGPAAAQNAASNKAFFSAGTDDVVLASVDGTPTDVTLFDVPAAFKTSSGGAASVTLSMECALWTYNTVTATVNAGKTSTSSRAKVEAWVEIDGVKATPAEVVYCDRAQAVGLQANLACQAGAEACTVTGDITLDLFQATKNANAFTFFAGPLGSITHHVKVKARGSIECWSSSANGGAGGTMPCPSSAVANWTNASTKALIGKRTMVLEEQNNWGAQ